MIAGWIVGGFVILITVAIFYLMFWFDGAPAPITKPSEVPVRIFKPKQTKKLAPSPYSVVYNSVTKKYYPKVGGLYLEETDFIDEGTPLCKERWMAESYPTKDGAVKALERYKAYQSNYKDTEEIIDI